MGLRIHPRTRVVQSAELEIGDAVQAVVEKHDLTYTEIMQILASTQLHWLKYALRDERHPDDPDKGGDEA
jgi:hypothetical protein